jgi:hypothetical protein
MIVPKKKKLSSEGGTQDCAQGRRCRLRCPSVLSQSESIVDCFANW